VERNVRDEAIILRVRRMAEIHASVLLVCREQGLLRAVAHGVHSARGRLRGLVSLYARGDAWFYVNPVSAQVKLNDFAVVDYHQGIRESLARIAVAAVWAESVEKSLGAGQDPRLYDLLSTGLQCLATADDAAARRLFVQFIWRYLALSGDQPDLEEDVIRGGRIPAGAARAYRPSAAGFTRVDSDSQEGRALQLSPAARDYLRVSEALGIDESMEELIDDIDLRGLANTLLRVLRVQIDGPLNSASSLAAYLGQPSA